MLKTLLLVVAGLGAGLAIAFWAQPGTPFLRTEPASAPGLTAGASEGAERAAPARLAQLENALQAEVERRAALEERVAALAAELESVRGQATEPEADTAADDPAQAPREPQRFARNAAAFGEDAQRRQVERLLAAGFPPDRAEWINRRTSELRMQALQQQYDATREGRPFEPGTALAGERTLRSELGDADYERYLQALDRPTSVAVRDVLASSPAERSGLKAGDEVVAYDGQRVFDMRELNALTLEGNAGESVAVEVQRDGQTIQLLMPRGPIGIFGGGFRGR